MCSKRLANEKTTWNFRKKKIPERELRPRIYIPRNRNSPWVTWVANLYVEQFFHVKKVVFIAVHGRILVSSVALGPHSTDDPRDVERHINLPFAPRHPSAWPVQHKHKMMQSVNQTVKFVIENTSSWSS